MIMLYHLHMALCFLGTFTEYPILYFSFIIYYWCSETTLLKSSKSFSGYQQICTKNSPYRKNNQ